MRAAIPSSPTRMRTCASRPAENSFRPRCATSYASAVQMDCTPDICPVIQPRTVASVCRKKTPLRFSMRLMSEHLSRYSDERQLDAHRRILDRRRIAGEIVLPIRASIPDLTRDGPRRGGGGDHLVGTDLRSVRLI